MKNFSQSIKLYLMVNLFVILAVIIYHIFPETWQAAINGKAAALPAFLNCADWAAVFKKPNAFLFSVLKFLFLANLWLIILKISTFTLSFLDKDIYGSLGDKTKTKWRRIMIFSEVFCLAAASLFIVTRDTVMLGAEKLAAFFVNMVL